MGDMNIHITWLTHVRTGPKKKNRPPASADLCTVQSTSANRTEQYTAVRDCRGTPVVIVSYWLCMSHVNIIKESHNQTDNTHTGNYTHAIAT